MRHAKIDYGFGKAELWGDFDEDTYQRFFMQHANQCFGIRKSVGDVNLLSIAECDGLPSPWNKFEGAVTVLIYAGTDTAVWNNDGEKIKSEFD